MMTRRTVCATALVAGVSALAAGCRERLSTTRHSSSAGRIARIGYVGDPPTNVLTTAFRAGLRDLGWLENQNLRVSYAGAQDTQPDVAVRAVLQEPVDVIVATTDPYIRAAHDATTTVPIVMVDSSDPVGLGFVQTLGRPGGSITGLSSFAPELNGKRLHLLKQTLPTATRFAALWNPDGIGAAANYRATEATATDLGVQLQSWELRTGLDVYAFLGMYDAAPAKRAEGVIVLKDPITAINTYHYGYQLAARSLPAILPFRKGIGLEPFERDVLLMAYAANEPALWRRAATYVDHILKGARPADLPVEQPRTFDFIINLRTAALLGLTLPPAVLAQATEIIH